MRQTKARESTVEGVAAEATQGPIAILAVAKNADTPDGYQIHAGYGPCYMLGCKCTEYQEPIGKIHGPCANKTCGHSFEWHHRG